MLWNMVQKCTWNMEQAKNTNFGWNKVKVPKRGT